MPVTRFMLDIETTGLSPDRDFILQIGALELKLTNHADAGIIGEYWIPARQFVTTLPYEGGPTSDFAKEHQVELYRMCNDAVRDPGTLTGSSLIGALHHFLGVDTPTKPQLMGRNLAGFDLKFLNQSAILMPSDYHYRVIDITPVIDTFATALGLTKEVAEARLIAWDITHTMSHAPADQTDHFAMRDCFKQTAILNGMLAWMRHANQ